MGSKSELRCTEERGVGSDERHSISARASETTPWRELEVYPVLAPGEGGGLLIVLRVAGQVALASSVVSWAEFEPPFGVQGAPAGRYILGKIEAVAQQLEDEFTTYCWTRVASELTQVRLLLARAEDNSRAS